MNGSRVVVITGASSGIGRALAERAVRSGDRVFATGRRAARLEELGAMLATATGELATLALDLREPRAAERIVAAARERFGRIDVLVNAAGAVAVGPIASQSDDALDEQLVVHVRVPLALAREALPLLRASRGQIVFFGSGVARIPVGTLGAYPPAKAAVRSLARVARNELRADGIAVTYVDPGAVATEFMTRAGFAGPPAAIAASPHDVARAVYAATRTRRPVVNAVPWQTFFVALGEALPSLTDALLRRAPQIVGGSALSAAPGEALEATEKVAALGETADFFTPKPSETHVAADAPGARAADAPGALAADAPGARAADAPPALASPAARTAAGAQSSQGEWAAGETDFARALAPVAPRMRKFNLRESFVASLLVPGSELDPSEVALRWAGMPNKHERALTHEVLEALAAAGFLSHAPGDGYRVLRAAG